MTAVASGSIVEHSKAWSAACQLCVKSIVASQDAAAAQQAAQVAMEMPKDLRDHQHIVAGALP